MKATNEDTIKKIVSDAKKRYSQYKRFIEYCKSQIKITDEAVFKIVYWDELSVNKYKKNGQTIIEGIDKSITEQVK